MRESSKDHLLACLAVWCQSRFWGMHAMPLVLVKQVSIALKGARTHRC